MQGISQSKHQHLIDALLQLEDLLSRDFKQNADRQLAADFHLELKATYTEYDRLLSELSYVIDGYNQLFGKVKVQFLSPKLKELRKHAAG